MAIASKHCWSPYFQNLKISFDKFLGFFHKAMLVFIISSQNVNIMTWPPYSPDLNVTEKVFSGWLTLEGIHRRKAIRI